MSVLKRSKRRHCTADVYSKRRDEVNEMYKRKSSQYNFVYFFKPINVYRPDHEAADGVHFNETGYLAFFVALRKALSWFINKIKKTIKS